MDRQLTPAAAAERLIAFQEASVTHLKARLRRYELALALRNRTIAKQNELIACLHDLIQAARKEQP